MFVCPECGDRAATGGACARDGAEVLPADHDPLLGLAIGQFRISRLIGQGGMGRVYRAVQPAIGGRLAIKFLAEARAADPRQVDRFFAEARAVNLIRHENIVNVVDLAKLDDGRPYITMEYLDGAPLSSIIERVGPLPLGGLTRLVLEVLDALAAAHARGIVHRDLKPDNVFVTPRGHAKVLDFGIAKLAPSQGGASSTGGGLVGTPAYIAPEQALAQPCDGRADLYAVGVILYEGVTGRRPFDASSTFEILHQHVYSTPPPPRDVRPELPAALEQIILRAIQKEPDARYASAKEMSAALETASSSLPAESFVNLCALAADRVTSAAATASTIDASDASVTLDPPATLGSAPALTLGAAKAVGTGAPRASTNRRATWIALAALAIGVPFAIFGRAWLEREGPPPQAPPASPAVEPAPPPFAPSTTNAQTASASAFDPPVTSTATATVGAVVTSTKSTKPAPPTPKPPALAIGSSSAAPLASSAPPPPPAATPSASGKPRKDIF